MTELDSLAQPWAPLHLRFNRIMASLSWGGWPRRCGSWPSSTRSWSGRVGSSARFAAPRPTLGRGSLRWSGRGEEADDRNLRAYQVSGGDGGPRADAHAEGHYVALLDLADGRLLRGDPAGAAALNDQLAPVDTWGGTMAWHQRHRLGLLRARLALSAGDDETPSAGERVATSCWPAPCWGWPIGPCRTTVSAP